MAKKSMHLFILLGLLFSLTTAWGKDGFTPKKLTLLQYFKLQHSLQYGHIESLNAAAKKDITDTHLNMAGLQYSGIIPWSPKKREVVKRFAIEKLSMTKLADKIPEFDKTQKLGKTTVDIKDIRWSQMAANNVSQDGKYTVINNAKSLRDGTLQLTKLPTIRVWRDTKGRIWTLDHRRLAAIKLSGVVRKLEVEFIDEATVLAQRFKFSNRNEGKTMFVFLNEPDAKTKKAVVLNQD